MTDKDRVFISDIILSIMIWITGFSVILIGEKWHNWVFGLVVYLIGFAGVMAASKKEKNDK